MTWTHGKTTGYRIHKCRCDDWLDAHMHAQQSFRSRRYAERVERSGDLVHPRAPHGTKNGYTNYGCRCDLCRDSTRRGVA